MPVTFRPLPGLTLATAVGFTILIGLGTWQLERLQWKLGLIARVAHNLSAPPISLPDALGEGASAQYRRVELTGTFANAQEAYAYATDKEGAPVYHVLVPFLTDRGVLMVDRGIVSPNLKNPRARQAGQVSGRISLIGVWRTPDPPGLFTPSPDVADRVWYARDVTSIAKADGVKLVAPVVIEADSKPNPGGWPKGGQTEVTFRNEHLQYAITWFGLAATLIGIYLAYHASHGRLALLEAPRTER